MTKTSSANGYTRRDFVVIGAAGALVAVLGLAGCTQRQDSNERVDRSSDIKPSERVTKPSDIKPSEPVEEAATQQQTNPLFEGDLFATKKDGLWGFVDEDGKVILDFAFDSVGSFVEGFCPVMIGSSWGIIKSSGEYLVNPESYHRIGNLDKGYFKVFDRGNTWNSIDSNIAIGVIDKSGETIINPGIWDACGLPNEGRFAALKDGYWGIVDLNGNTVVDFVYDEMCNWANGNNFIWNVQPHHDFVSGLIGVQINKGYGVIDSEGNWILDLRPENYNITIVDNLIQTKNDLYDINGNHLYHGSYCVRLIKEYSEGTVMVQLENSGIETGEVLILDAEGDIIWNGNNEIQEGYDFVYPSGYYTTEATAQTRDWFCVNMGAKFSNKPKSTFINGTGQKLFDWRMYGSYPRVFTSTDYVSLYLDNNGMTDVFDLNGNLVTQLEGQYSLVNNHCLTAKGTRFNEFYLYSLVDNQTISSTSILWLQNNEIAIVCDENGVFYGLYAYGELKRGFEYTSIDSVLYETNGNSGHYAYSPEGYYGDYEFLSAPLITLKKGNSEETVFVTKKGDLIAANNLRYTG